MSSKIIRLEESVVNRIAAGEVVQRPFNALKEMIENSLDAKASNISVTVKEGGLKYLQIQDNGTGVNKEDLEILCERFTTSKLQKFEDLLSISTYGFRGEALASISHVAHVTVLTKNANSKCAFRVSYVDGKPKDVPKPCAGNQGTQIIVEDLFYNVPTRRKALKSPSEEYGKIVDVVSRYAVHNPSVGFVLKKQGENTSDVQTPSGSTVLENLRILYGNAVAKELLDVTYEDKSLKFKCGGYISNANYSTKKGTLILFINHRLVDSQALRKALSILYAAYLPSGTHSFVYLSLEIAPNQVDVNVHPTKHEVHFLHEDSIIGKIQECLEVRLLNCNSSRVLYTQTFLPGASQPEKTSKEQNSSQSDFQNNKDKNTSSNNSKVVYDKDLVRTDSKERKLDSFLNKSSALKFTYETGKNSTEVQESAEGQREKNPSIPPPPVSVKKTNTNTSTSTGTGTSGVPSKPESAEMTKTFTNTKRNWDVKLSSVLALRKEVDDECQAGLKEIVQDYSFVGCVNRQYALIQHSTKLYLLNTAHLSEELFYQIMLLDFGNFGIFRFATPLSLYELATIALDSEECDWKEEYGPKDELANRVKSLLASKAEMLEDYFSMSIDKEGNLVSIPYLLDKYVPSLEGLPMYVLRLSTDVEWGNEKECFRTFCRETARFYAFRKTEYAECNPSEEEEEEAAASTSKQAGGETLSKDQNWKATVEHVLYPAMRSTLKPSETFSENGSILQIANLPDLYKVFERC